MPPFLPIVSKVKMSEWIVVPQPWVLCFSCAAEIAGFRFRLIKIATCTLIILTINNTSSICTYYIERMLNVYDYSPPPSPPFTLFFLLYNTNTLPLLVFTCYHSCWFCVTVCITVMSEPYCPLYLHKIALFSTHISASAVHIICCQCDCIISLIISSVPSAAIPIPPSPHSSISIVTIT